MERYQFNREEHKGELKRFAITQPVEVDSTANKVKGYAAVWNVVGSNPSELYLWPKGCMVLPDYGVRMLYDHKGEWILAREDNETLQIAFDDFGVGVAAQLDSTFLEDYILTKMSKGTIKGMSVGVFELKAHKEDRLITEDDAKGNPDLKSLVGKTVSVTVSDLLVLDEVTITPNPVFPQTSIEQYKKLSEESPTKEGNQKEKAERFSRYEKEAKFIGLRLLEGRAEFRKPRA